MANHRGLVFALDEILTECGIETSKDLLEIEPLLRGHLQLIPIPLKQKHQFFQEQLEFISSRGRVLNRRNFARLCHSYPRNGRLWTTTRRGGTIFSEELTKSDSWKNGR
jgi:hypothetical protein